MCKVLFGLIDLDMSKFFRISPMSNTRRHPYKLLVPHCRVDAGKWFFTNRAVKVWNSLPAMPNYFIHLTAFRKFVNDVNLDRFLSDLL
jgi:hypothetical protein